MSNIIPNESFILEELIYIPMGQYTPVPVRPYQFNLTPEAADTISDRMAVNRTNRVASTLLNGVASQVVTPSAVGFESAVNNGFVNQPKFMFLLKVHHIDHMGLEKLSYIFGYTDYDGLSYAGSLDPQMGHYINNIVETVVSNIQTPLGVARVEKLHNIYATHHHANNSDNGTIYTQRPVDLYQSMNAGELSQFMGGDITFNNATSMITPFSQNVVSSGVGNNITTEYLSSLLTNGLDALKDSSLHVNSYEIHSNNPTERFFVEPSISENVFVRYMSRLSGHRYVTPTFQMATLMQIDNTIESRANVIKLTKDLVPAHLQNTPEVGEYWHGQDIVTTKAYSLLENSVALATKYGFPEISFICTNRMDASGQTHLAFTHFRSFMSLQDPEYEQLLEIFKFKFINEIFLNESNCGQIPIYMEVHVDLYRTTKILLEFMHFQPTWFTIPTFANSHFSPVLTNNQNTLDASAYQLRSALDVINQATAPKFY